MSKRIIIHKTRSTRHINQPTELLRNSGNTKRHEKIAQKAQLFSPGNKIQRQNPPRKAAFPHGPRSTQLQNRDRGPKCRGKQNKSEDGAVQRNPGRTTRVKIGYKAGALRMVSESQDQPHSTPRPPEASVHRLSRRDRPPSPRLSFCVRRCLLVRGLTGFTPNRGVQREKGTLKAYKLVLVAIMRWIYIYIYIFFKFGHLYDAFIYFF